MSRSNTVIPLCFPLRSRDALQRIMQTTNLDLPALAKRLRVSERSLGRWVEGTARPPGTVIERIAREFRWVFDKDTKP